MAFKKLLLETVVDIVRRTILVGNNFVDNYSSFRLYLILRERRRSCQFHQKAYRLREVFLEYGRVDDNLLLIGKSIEIASETVEVIIYNRGASIFSTPEDCMFGESAQ